MWENLDVELKLETESTIMSKKYKWKGRLLT